MEPVKLLKHDTCYTYALKRVGICTLEHLLLESNDFIRKYQSEMIDEKDLEIGDILVLILEDIGNGNKVRVQDEITKSSVVLTNSKHYNIHFMVYEGEGVISHTVWSDLEGRWCYEIKQKRLSDGSDNWYRLKLPK